MSTDPSAPIPNWRDTTIGGGMVRVAAWLAAEVGEGNLFSKQQLREIFPGVEQIDRRMRDLRRFGWIIDDYRQDYTLQANQLRLVTIGTRVWDAADRSAVSQASISDRVRQHVFARDNHQCRRCGINAGEVFDDDVNTHARLTAAHIYPGLLRPEAAGPEQLITACQRCNESLRQNTPNYLDGEQVWQRIREIPRAEKGQLADWMIVGRRVPSRWEVLFGQWWQLPGEERDEVLRRLREQLDGR
jgi:hypothetical protein